MNQLTIKEIKERLLSREAVDANLLQRLKVDERKSVQQLLKSYEQQVNQQEELKQKFIAMSQFEMELWNSGINHVCGLDDVGRGALIGPTVVSGVILPKDFYLPGLNDSKALSKKQLAEFYDVITAQAVAIGIGVVSAEEIDQLNIYQASKKAMQIAVQSLKITPDYLLIDAMEIPSDIPQKSIIKGDQKSISIAAGSVIAKVTRDNMMKELGKAYPQYKFEKHMGYPTQEHLQAIKKYGILPEHRKSFGPVKEIISPAPKQELLQLEFDLD
ncbi:ribonuclease HII [Niallia taxi]|uniref:ribonuclease HII n=1 Tax=Niallia taxi TaxID=2499688 RepID=UPI0015F3C59E|nr:ribonuclease HII [Niallia taxi]